MGDSEDHIISRLNVYTERFHDWLEPIEIVITIKRSIEKTFWSDPSYWGGIYQCVESEIAGQDS